MLKLLSTLHALPSLRPKATPERLLDYLLEESVDDNYHMDFLLTYRTFLQSPDPIIEKLLKAWNERVDLRKRVRPCHLFLHMNSFCILSCSPLVRC